jgi:O-antigen/teichoic acid export membrane protein
MIIVPVSIGNCLCGQFIQCIVQVFQCFQMMRTAAFWSGALNGLRLLAVVSMTTMHHHATANQWAWASALVTTLVAVVGSAAVTAKFGAPALDPALLMGGIGEGALFSVSSSTASAYNDLDKTLLSHYGMNVANGIYTTAYRIVDLATIPVSSVEWVTLPRFFREGTSGVQRTVQLAQRVLPRSILIGLISGSAAFLCAPLIPRILGQNFAESAIALRWLCLLPAFRAVHLITGAALTGAGYQRYRTTAQAAVVLLNLAVNLAWMPHYGWLGAAWASLISDGVLGVTCWMLMLWIGRRDRARQDGPQSVTGRAPL